MDYVYKSDALDEAIKCASEAQTMMFQVTNSISLITGLSIPSNFSGINNLQNNLNNINDLRDNVTSLYSKFIDIKAFLEEAEASDKVMESGLSTADYISLVQKGYTRIDGSKYGVSGYVFVPNNKTNLSGMAMMVYIGGNGASESNGNILIGNNSLPYYLSNNGTILADMVIYCPVANGVLTGSNLTNTQSQIESLANTINADKDRISIMGHSDGGRSILNLVSSNPDYYSVCVSLSGPVLENNSSVMNSLANNKTTQFIFITGAREGVEADVTKAYNTIVSNGGKAIHYRLDGIGHETQANAVSDELLVDISNIKKGTTSPSNNEVINVSTEDAKKGSIRRDRNASYYKTLSNGTVSTTTDVESTITNILNDNSNTKSNITLKIDNTNEINNVDTNTETNTIVTGTETNTIVTGAETNTGNNTYTGTSTNTGNNTYTGTSTNYSTSYINSSNTSTISTDSESSKVINLNDGDTVTNIDYILRKNSSVSDLSNKITDTTVSTSTKEVENIVNNYYYDSNTNSSSEDLNTNNDTVSYSIPTIDDTIKEISEVEDIPIVDEVVDNNINEVSEYTGAIEIHPHANPNIVESSATKTKSGVIPATLAAVGTAAAGIAAKLFIKKKDKSEDE